MQRLLLPEPRFHECVLCGITSDYVEECDIRSTLRLNLHFIEHGGPLGDELNWELCDLCEAERVERYNSRAPSISVHRGTADWSGDFQGYFGFEKMPLICVSTANATDYHNGRERDRETWLFCRDRAEWRSAWQIARILAKNGNRADRFEHLLMFLPAWKPPGEDSLDIVPTVLNAKRTATGPLVGECDCCGAYEVVVPELGTQWANCVTCHQRAEERREERGAA